MFIDNYPKISSLIGVLSAARGSFSLTPDFLPPFRDLVRSGELDQLLVDLNRGILEGHIPQGVTISETGILLAESSHWALTLTCYEQNPSPGIHFPCAPTLFGNCSPQPRSIRVLTQANAENSLGLGGLELLKSVKVEPGDSIAFTDTEQTADIYASHSACHLTLVDLRASGEALRWRFDPISLAAIGSAIADRRTSFLRSVIDSFGHLASKVEEGKSLAPALDRFSKHEHHIVRWAAIQALGRIDFQQALPALARAQADDHPEIRAAAKRLLRKI